LENGRCKSWKIQLSGEKSREALTPLASLPLHPEVKVAGKILENAGYKMVY